MTCSVSTCERPVYGWSWCSVHYKRWRKTGDVREHEPLGRYSPEANARTSARMTGVTRGPMSVDQRAAISAAKRGRPNGIAGRPVSPDTRQKISVANAGDRNQRWKGDEVGYVALHERLRKLLPFACAHCGATRPLECALKHDAVGPLKTDEMRVNGKVRTLTYSTSTDDYMRLCVACHRRYDLVR